MKYLDLESTRILKVDEIYPYSLQCDACQQIFIREPAIFHFKNIHHKDDIKDSWRGFRASSGVEPKPAGTGTFLPCGTGTGMRSRFVFGSWSNTKWKDKSQTSQKIQKWDDIFLDKDNNATSSIKQARFGTTFSIYIKPGSVVRLKKFPFWYGY
jgi:hypothetical protein